MYVEKSCAAEGLRARSAKKGAATGSAQFDAKVAKSTDGWFDGPEMVDDEAESTRFQAASPPATVAIAQLRQRVRTSLNWIQRNGDRVNERVDFFFEGCNFGQLSKGRGRSRRWLFID